MNGAVLVDKPAGISSAQAIAKLKRKFHIIKIGHAGTLDPFATGLLTVLCGNATKLQDIFLNAEKTYSGLIKLGIATDTDDITGQIINRDLDRNYFTEQTPCSLAKTIEQRFLGTSKQIPPAYSALKVSGRRSYALARAGVIVEHQPRDILIKSFKLEFRGSDEISFRVHCSKGTYIRSLARDIGSFLNSFATLQTLRREVSSPFSIEKSLELDAMLSLEQLEGVIIPPSDLVSHLPSIIVGDSEVIKLANGNKQSVSDLFSSFDNAAKNSKLCCVFSKDKELICIVERVEHSGWRIRAVFTNNFKD